MTGVETRLATLQTLRRKLKARIVYAEGALRKPSRANGVGGGGLMEPPIRVLLAKVGLDGHDRGVKVVARILRDAGVEVVYTGLHRAPAEVVEAALQEDVDVLGVSLLSGAHLTLVPRLLAGLRERGAGDIVVVLGGVIPDADAVHLKALGVAEVFVQDTPPDAIVAAVRRGVAARRAFF